MTIKMTQSEAITFSQYMDDASVKSALLESIYHACVDYQVSFGKYGASFSTAKKNPPENESKNFYSFTVNITALELINILDN